MNIYVGNLAYGTTDDDLRDLFSGFGEVKSARVIMDRETGRSRGFGFVEMYDEGQGQQAIDATNGNEFMGRVLKVNVARPRQERGGGGGGRGGGGYRNSW